MIDLAAAILRYLQEHPHACDTAEGVGQWWLQGAGERDAISAALDRLVSAGHLERVSRPSGDVFRPIVRK